MLVYLRKWSQDPVLLAKNIVVVLVTESLAELDRSSCGLVGRTREVEIVRPDPVEGLTPIWRGGALGPERYAAQVDLPLDASPS